MRTWTGMLGAVLLAGCGSLADAVRRAGIEPAECEMLRSFE